MLEKCVDDPSLNIENIDEEVEQKLASIDSGEPFKKLSECDEPAS